MNTQRLKGYFAMESRNTSASVRAFGCFKGVTSVTLFISIHITLVLLKRGVI